MVQKIKRYKLRLNSEEKLEELLQESYDEACRLAHEAQTELTKLAEATKLSDEPLEGKAKYAKAINDYLNTKDKALSRKIEISKLMSDVIKYGGNMQEALEKTMVTTNGGSLDIDKLKEIANNAYNNTQPQSKSYTINEANYVDEEELANTITRKKK